MEGLVILVQACVARQSRWLKGDEFGMQQQSHCVEPVQISLSAKWTMVEGLHIDAALNFETLALTSIITNTGSE